MPLLLIIRCVFVVVVVVVVVAVVVEIKAKFFREVLKNTRPSATLINVKLCYNVSEVKG